jgi:hypothetical protein
LAARKEHHAYSPTALLPNKVDKVIFQVLMAASMKMTVFWDVAPCRLVEVYQRFRGARCFHHEGNDHPDDGHIKHEGWISKDQKYKI